MARNERQPRARTGGRAVALQVLYALDASPGLSARALDGLDIDGYLSRYWASFEDEDAQVVEPSPETRAFADALVAGLVDRIEEVDAAIRATSQHWRLERMPRVDRCVLRVCTYELLFCPDVPRAVAIDEAVELAKRFGAEESGRFVNGLLERIGPKKQS